jgi:site-specific DNA-methyltransferase (adenine-specific)
MLISELKKTKYRRNDLIDKLFHIDNFELLKQIEDNSLDLVYIDPPYFSQEDYGDFLDKWDNITEYLNFMKVRIKHIHRVLKKSGSFYLQCDYHASHYLKIICDYVFGYDQFQNEIIWKYGKGISWNNKKYIKNFDSILFYKKSDRSTFNVQIKKYNKRQLDRFKYKDEKGRYYLDTRRNADGNKKRVKVYLTKKGIPLGSVWYFPIVNSFSEENYDYATQKPEGLLRRIIKASSNVGDLVADFFCGSGTTLAVAKQERRKYLGCDRNKKAIKRTKKRLKETSAFKDIKEIAKKKSKDLENTLGKFL